AIGLARAGMTAPGGHLSDVRAERVHPYGHRAAREIDARGVTRVFRIEGKLHAEIPVPVAAPAPQGAVALAGAGVAAAGGHLGHVAAERRDLGWLRRPKLVGFHAELPLVV